MNKLMFFVLLPLLLLVEIIETKVTPFWPLEGGEILQNLPTPRCDVCQELVRFIIDNTKNALVKARKGNGAVDFALMNTLNSTTACSFGVWKDRSDQLGTSPVYEMTTLCKLILDKYEETFEKIIPKALNDDSKARKEICVPIFCNETWTPDLFPGVREAKSTRNLRHSREFLEWNAKQEGVIQTISGLQYRAEVKLDEEAAKSAKSPTINTDLEVYYTGKNLAGVVFDSTAKTGVEEPVLMHPKSVIEGWREGLMLMKEGETFTFYIPPKLGYGTRGAGETIGPNELLIFKVTIKKVKDEEILDPNEEEDEDKDVEKDITSDDKENEISGEL